MTFTYECREDKLQVPFHFDTYQQDTVNISLDLPLYHLHFCLGGTVLLHIFCNHFVHSNFDKSQAHMEDRRVLLEDVDTFQLYILCMHYFLLLYLDKTQQCTQHNLICCWFGSQTIVVQLHMHSKIVSLDH